MNIGEAIDVNMMLKAEYIPNGKRLPLSEHAFADLAGDAGAMSRMEGVMKLPKLSKE